MYVQMILLLSHMLSLHIYLCSFICCFWCASTLGSRFWTNLKVTTVFSFTISMVGSVEIWGETSHNLESSCCSAMLSAGHQNVQKVGMGLHEVAGLLHWIPFSLPFTPAWQNIQSSLQTKKKQNVRLSCLLVFLIKASTTLNMAHPDISVRHPGIAEIIVWSSVS